jgi:hypothetical protein
MDKSVDARDTTAMAKQDNLAADLRTRGCPVCNRVIKTARDFFAQWQYALSRDEAAQQKFAAELGFCPRHMWQLHSMSSPWGESYGLAGLTETISARLAEACASEEPALQRGRAVGGLQKDSRTRSLLPGGNACRICAMLEEAEADYVKKLAVFISDRKGAEIYERSQGVCLRHLARLLALVSDPAGEFLLRTASSRFAQLAQQMRSYAAKREAVRRDLISADEEHAPVRALIHLAGAEEYSGP